MSRFGDIERVRVRLVELGILKETDLDWITWSY